MSKVWIYRRNSRIFIAKSSKNADFWLVPITLYQLPQETLTLDISNRYLKLYHQLWFNHITYLLLDHLLVPKR